jgi:hypothetical protein
MYDPFSGVNAADFQRRNPSIPSRTMKTTRQLMLLITAVAIATAISLWAAEPATSATPARPAWEHHVLEREGSIVATDRDLAGQINRLGTEGWEMYAVTPVQVDGTTKRIQFYFKRPKI